MKKRWNVMEKMAVCSFAAVMTVMVGTGFGMTARAEMIIDSEEDIQTVMEMVPESEDMEALPVEDWSVDVPAVQSTTQGVQEDGEITLDVSQIVVIEENQIPGAALPDFDLESSEAEAEAPQDMVAEDAQEAEAEDEQSAEAEDAQEAEAEDGQSAEAEDEQEAKTETGVSGTITYEDSEMLVTVVVSEEAQLPADTEVKVTKLEEGSEKFETAKEAARQSLAAGDNAVYTFYDVTLESEGQALDVEEGTVSVRMEFKTDAKKKEVVSIEETENGKVARNVTDTAAAEGRVGSTAIAY